MSSHDTEGRLTAGSMDWLEPAGLLWFKSWFYQLGCGYSQTGALSLLSLFVHLQVKPNSGVVLLFVKLRQRDRKFQVSLSYTMTSCLNSNYTEGGGRESP